MKKEILKNVFRCENLKRLDVVNDEVAYNLQEMEMDDCKVALNRAVILHSENKNIDLAKGYVFNCEHKNHFETREYRCEKVIANIYDCDKSYLHTIYCLDVDYDFVDVDGKIVYFYNGKIDSISDKFLPLIKEKVYHKLFEFEN